VVLFAQTRIGNTRDSWGVNKKNRQRDTSLPKDDKFKDYTRYAADCLNLMAEAKDLDSQNLRRAMAEEWLALASAIRRSRKSWRIVPFNSR
jgi:hypothetical protein